MKERPIIFSSSMVRVILSGKKTQTRRIIKRPKHLDEKYYPINVAGRFWWAIGGMSTGLELICPYGYPQSRLWIRETWAADTKWDKLSPKIIPTHSSIWYKADLDKNDTIEKWRPSIHMPRWASRITLEITDVRVERLQDISPRDIIEEGIKQRIDLPPAEAIPKEKQSFIELWDSINAKRGYGWEQNPWVWIIDFKILEK